jgi:hypothetical protein
MRIWCNLGKCGAQEQLSNNFRWFFTGHSFQEVSKALKLDCYPPLEDEDIAAVISDLQLAQINYEQGNLDSRFSQIMASLIGLYGVNYEISIGSSSTVQDQNISVNAPHLQVPVTSFSSTNAVSDPTIPGNSGIPGTEPSDPISES